MTHAVTLSLPSFSFFLFFLFFEEEALHVSLICHRSNISGQLKLAFPCHPDISPITTETIQSGSGYAFWPQHCGIWRRHMHIVQTLDKG